ncbi:7-carboxy-7-deazaguanine synthase QueE [Anabaena sp. FACHB-1237]|uniref:7-carboxy-7-deazaguanine synthase QueE n=1 Tax=Anabaena sp. FACHB-1237 TaxID=2692769 RepID=UPI00168016CF|nr:7-carboxy-7-deazaguanine synthase QueE [Anabaena sp. FACHB-1237]MBD2136270.1 7-carboxy-7-deazaguanine synthase QueE [Anabaena sp. FACHB-1237]
MITKDTIDSTARLIEVFSAIQGEGMNVGTRQIFIRFAICDLRCSFCDSMHTWNTPPTCKIERSPGLRDFEIHSNPVKLQDLLRWINRQNLSFLHDSISLTGGEPLLHVGFLQQFLPQLRSLIPLPIYLETGGHRPKELQLILPYLDSVGMDLKLPSVSGETYWTEHEQFLQICFQSYTEVFVKIIVSQNTDIEELKRASCLVGGISPNISIFLQPVTPLERSSPSILPPSPEQILQWQALMKDFVKSVRVIPQTHKMLNQL